MLRHCFSRSSQIIKHSTLRVFCTRPTEVKVRRFVSQEDVDRFAEVSGDTNFVHSLCCPSEQRCVHGALLNGFVSAVIGTQLPGPGAVVVKQEFSFPNKCVADEEIEVAVRLIDDRKIKKIGYEIRQNDKVVFVGTADVLLTKQ